MDVASLSALLHHAEALYRAGRHADAWHAIAHARPLISAIGPALRSYARIAMGAGAIDEAVDALKQAASNENNPVDVIGGLADLLGNVGRIDESIHYWTLLTDEHPELADAHLNLAVTAANGGMFAVAVEASETGLGHFPGHARLTAIRAHALANDGRATEAVDVFHQAVAADPNRPLTRYNQALALRTLHRFDEACEAFGNAERLGLEGPDFDASWASAALNAGKVDDAIGLYDRALRVDPSHQESLKALTAIQFEFGDAGEAFAHFERSLDKRKGSLDAWLDWIGELLANYRYDTAAHVGERALGMHPRSNQLTFLTTLANGMSEDAGQALVRLSALPSQLLQSNAGLLGRAQLALRAGDATLAARLAEESTQLDAMTQTGWALLGLAWRLLGDPREEWLCDYEKLVMVVDVVPADSDLDAMQYAALVATTLEPLHSSRGAPGNQSLRHGTQTRGHLLSGPDPEIQRFREAVVAATRATISHLPRDETHPFLSRKSTDLGFSGSWSVRLQAGVGHHVPHFHNQGWMSSAYYARLPAADTSNREAHEGWIEFGKPPEMFNLSLAPRRIVEPIEGRLVLFPSYLWHGTVPFSRGTRLTAAFDFQPR